MVKIGRYIAITINPMIVPSTTIMMGSSMLVINPPYGLGDALREALPALAERLSLGDGGWKLSKP